MSRVASQSERLAPAAVAAMLLWAGASGMAVADACVQACRADHNACRMAAKLLLSARCDNQLQSCISQCFASSQYGREPRDVRPPRDLRDLRGPRGLGLPDGRH